MFDPEVKIYFLNAIFLPIQISLSIQNMLHVQSHFHESEHTVGRCAYVRLFHSHDRNSSQRVSEWQETMYIFQPYARFHRNVVERVPRSGSCGWFE